MAEVIKMPKMSDTMTEGVLISWSKKVGDEIKSGDILAEVETDKATMELESYEDGTLLYIGAKENDKVPVGAILAIVGKKGEDYNILLQNSKSEDHIKGIESEKQNNQNINTTEKENQENKVEKEVRAPEYNNSLNLDLGEGTQNSGQSSSNELIENTRIKASPLAKSIAKDMGYDLSKIVGSGDEGRIIKKDLNNINTVNNQNITQNQQNTQNINLPIYEEAYEDISVTSMRSAIANNLRNSLSNAPHFYITDEIRMCKVTEMRNILNSKEGINISFNDIIIKAVSLAIRKYPEINVSWLNDKIRYNKHIHIGIAVAIKDGLVVPTLKFADTKNLSQISSEIKDMINKAKAKKLSANEMQGSTFSVSNLGMFGIESFTSIINPPESCILAIGAIKKKPIVDENGDLVVGHQMKITLSCDHRTVDGAIGAQFITILKQIFEEPISMLL